MQHTATGLNARLGTVAIVPKSTIINRLVTDSLIAGVAWNRCNYAHSLSPLHDSVRVMLSCTMIEIAPVKPPVHSSLTRLACRLSVTGKSHVQMWYLSQ